MMRHGFAMTKPMSFTLDPLLGRGSEKGWRRELADLLNNLGESRQLPTDRNSLVVLVDYLERAHDIVMQPSDVENLELSDLEDLRQQGRDTEAFFLARRMAAQGVEGAKELVTEILGDLDG